MSAGAARLASVRRSHRRRCRHPPHPHMWDGATRGSSGASIMRPLIGITCSVIARPAPQRPVYGISQAYSAAIERAGGIPVLLPPQSDPDAARTLCARLDGLLFTGGGDLDPATYGEDRRSEC